MYSQKLEAIIEAALADGVLTDKERAVLHKKAAEEGVDPDELDVVIEGRLAKMKRETDWLRPTPPKENTKMGNVQKCPSCGAPYQPGMGSCPECGHVFQNVAANSSAQRLAEGISEIEKNYSEKIAKASSHKSFWDDGSPRDKMEQEKWNAITNYINNFVVPSSKDDLLEFIISMNAKRHTKTIADNGKEGADAYAFAMMKAYGSKYKESVAKAKAIFPNDEQLINTINETSKFKLSNINLTTGQKILLGFILFFLAYGVLIACL